MLLKKEYFDQNSALNENIYTALKEQERGYGLSVDLWVDRGSVKCQEVPLGENDK